MKRRTVIFILILAALLPLLIMREFTPSNELRYLNIADEAIANGNLFAFTDHGIPYADKPPLYFWIAIGLKFLFGKHIMFLLSLLSVMPAFVIAWVMDKWTEDKLQPCERTAGTLILFTSLYFLASSIVLRMDMLMCMFIVLSLYEFYKLYTNKDGELAARNRTHVKSARQYRIDRALLPVFVFLAIFSKGAVGFLVPVISIIVFLAADRNLRIIGKYLGWRFWTILLCLCIVWFTGVYVDGGKAYLDNLLFNQTVNRAVNSFHHKKPFWYYGIAYWYVIPILTPSSLRISTSAARSSATRRLTCSSVRTTPSRSSCLTAMIRMPQAPRSTKVSSKSVSMSNRTSSANSP